jgi:hypothetical protein
VERAILMIGAWELAHQPEIPYRVTINEAIELGKRFGRYRWPQVCERRPRQAGRRRAARRGREKKAERNG